MDPFAALADPNRRLLMSELGRGPQTVGALTEGIGLSQPAVSKHLRVLRAAELVRVRPDGQRRWYEVNPAPLREVDEWLEPFRRQWAQRLDRLEQHLDDTESTPPTESTEPAEHDHR
ncbi:MAG: metalloregulator ArsR/SmtB family transcription factor [Actinomycetota bacterium]